MKKVILSACVMLIAIAAYGQRDKGTVTLQPKVGLNIASLTNDGDADSRFAPVVGAEVEVQATDMVSFSGGLLYSMQGAKGKVGNVDGTVKLDYINVPILANVYVANGFAVKLGVQPGFLINNKVKVSQNGVNAEVDLEKAFKAAGIDAKLNKVDVSIPMGVSYEFSNINIAARYNWGVTKIIDEDSSKNSVFQITVGYKFAL